MNKTKSVILVLAVVFVMTGLVSAQAQGAVKQQPQEKRGKIFKELNLTPQQEKKLDENRKSQRQEMKRLFSLMLDKQDKLEAAFKNPKVTKASIEPLVKEIKSLQAQLIDNRISGMFAVKQILSPEQFVKFQQMAEKRREGKKKLFSGRRGEF
ncbi:MAG: periplasmic heavy metal sensor [Candidatus Omnitrophica bacterium]|nr:periplasmic heavy metal sensor [Candidatus Omnitrophota bacterium]